MKGIRFKTTERETPWFGTCIDADLKQLTAPTDFFINGLFGVRCVRTTIEFGVRLDPRESRDKMVLGHELERGAQCPLLCPRPDGEADCLAKTFLVSQYHLRAIVFKWGYCERMERVDVLSSRQYERVIAANNDRHHTAVVSNCETMIVLTEGEEIVSVDVAYSTGKECEEYVVAVRVTTTRSNKGHWYGELPSKKSYRIVAHDARQQGEKEVKMTGFRGFYDKNPDHIMELEPVYHYVVQSTSCMMQ